MRQLTDPSGDVTLARAYDPYGVTRDTAHVGSDTSYGFTGEFTENTGMIYLRARHYSPSLGRFMTRDTWNGDANMPMSYNVWAYAYANPVNLLDPTGHIPEHCLHIPPSNWPYAAGCAGYTPSQITIPCLPPGGLGSGEPTDDPSEPPDDLHLPGMPGRVYETYLKLRDTAGWWNEYTAGNFDKYDFLERIFSYEFFGPARIIEPNILVQDVVRNFYFICPRGEYGMDCTDFGSMSNIMGYIAAKHLLSGAGREMLLTKDMTPEQVNAVWADRTDLNKSNIAKLRTGSQMLQCMAVNLILFN